MIMKHLSLSLLALLCTNLVQAEITSTPWSQTQNNVDLTASLLNADTASKLFNCPLKEDKIQVIEIIITNNNQVETVVLNRGTINYKTGYRASWSPQSFSERKMHIAMLTTFIAAVGAGLCVSTIIYDYAPQHITSLFAAIPVTFVTLCVGGAVAAITSKLAEKKDIVEAYCAQSAYTIMPGQTLKTYLFIRSETYAPALKFVIPLTYVQLPNQETQCQAPTFEVALSNINQATSTN